MIRGTTPQHTFLMPFNTDLIKVIHIIYMQNDVTVLKKTNSDITLSGSNASVKLTQEDTLMFSSDSFVDIQIRVLTNGNDALASNIITIRCERLLSDEVLV